MKDEQQQRDQEKDGGPQGAVNVPRVVYIDVADFLLSVS
jgi:hypothetical protein